jgi:PAS domain S-box-containing protein
VVGTGLTIYTMLVPLGIFLVLITGFAPRTYFPLIPPVLVAALISGLLVLRSRIGHLNGAWQRVAAWSRRFGASDDVSDQLAAFMDLSPSLALETDAQGLIVYLGGSLRQRWRSGGEEATAGCQLAHPLVAPDSTTAFAQFTREILAGSQPNDLRMNLRPDSGADIPVRVSGRPINEGKGSSVRGMRAVFTDITCEVDASANHQRAMERDMVAANRKLMDIIEFLPDATFVIDQEKKVVAWNRAMEELTGVPKEEMVGQGDYAYSVPFYGERLPVLIDHFGDANLGDWRQLYNFVEVNKDTLYAESFIPFLNEGRGSYLWVTASPLFDSEGNIVGAIESLRDITYRKRSEEALRSSEERYRKLSENLERRVDEGTRELRDTNVALRDSEARFRRIIENLREGHIFYSHDTNGTFNYVSPSHADVLGYQDRDHFVARLQVWLESPRNELAREAAQQCRLGFKQPAYDLEVVHQDGSTRTMEILEVPVFNEDGQVESVEGLGRDVTEARRNLELVRKAQEQLIESQKMGALGTLVAGLSHEINTPVGIGVTAVSHLAIGARECLASYRQGDLTRSAFEEFLESSNQTIDLVQSNLNRAADLLQNFKQVAADQSGGHARVFELDDYLDDVIRSLSPRLRNTGYKLNKRCEPDLFLNCDPGALYQIISNLVMNSLTHGFDGLLVGEITLNVRSEGGHAILEYSDDGTGMKREQLARLYEPFFTTKRGRGGTGLGMHIVYNNVTQVLGGTISCSSRPGKGIRFVLDVPLHQEVGHA